jgi:tetraacyldisaccharide-1-P 4'-kinase
MKVVSFSGIARPRAFEADLARLGVVQVDSVRFRDHQSLGPRALARLAESVRRNRPDLLITTEKDRARLGQTRLPAPACALRIRMFPENESELMSLLASRIASSPSSPAGS